MIITVRLDGERRTAIAEAGEPLDRIAAKVGWPLNTVCGGRGRCGRCVVLLHSGRFRIRGRDELEIHLGRPQRVLACQTVPLEGADCVVEIPEASRRSEPGRIVTDCALPVNGWRSRLHRIPLSRPPDQPGTVTSDAELAWEAARAAGAQLELDMASIADLTNGLARDHHGELWWVDRDGRALAGGWRSATAGEPMGLAVDIGTTTIAAALVELASGRLLATASDYNTQLSRGEDVASRISASEAPGGLEELQRLVLETVNGLIRRLCASASRSSDDILHVLIAGNTVMEHLVLGLSPSGIGRIPFRPAARRYPPLRAQRLGLEIPPLAWIEMVPSLAGYIGGDLTADATVARLLERRGRWLLVDVGTNGEILFWDGQRLRGAATAAGPAFEGAGLSCGMRADAGAVEHLRWRSGQFEYITIAEALPAGLCGSAVVDALAELARAGLLDRTGRLDFEALERTGAAAIVNQGGHELRAVLIAPAEQSAQGRPIVLSEADIAEALKAKAAIHAGIVTLLRFAGTEPCELDGLILAGGFGRHLHLRNAMRMGLLPVLPLERIEVIGNGALGGALQGLGDPSAPQSWDRLLELLEPIELNLCEDFEAEFVHSLLIPHADPSSFAAVLDADLDPPSQTSPSTSRQTA